MSFSQQQAPRSHLVGSRELALQVVRDVFGPQPRGAQSSFDYRARATSLDARDRAFAAELAYGSIKQRRLLDWYLAPYIGERAQTLPPTIREVLRLGIYQLQFMDRVEEHAAVYETVVLALRHGHRGTGNLVNAVLRRFTRERPAEPQREAFKTEEDYLGARFSLPTWITAQWRGVFEGRCPEICEGVNRVPRQSVRVNALRSDVESVRALLAERGIESESSSLVAEVLLLERSAIDDDIGQAWAVQSESSAMAVDLLDPKPEETIVELCSGRGNKSVQSVARMRNRGRLEAIEIDEEKIEHWRRTLERAGATCASCSAGDARNLEDRSDADGVLVDAPCSGVGVIGRHPEARWRKRPDDGARLADIQRDLLASGARRVRMGGRLVYGVCSTDPREGRAVVDEFLRQTPSFIRGPLPDRYQPFVQDGDVLVPPGIEGRDGFALAVLTRTVR
ncbi:MAG TPA: 16S rRNA (cytosine(967)-C(5))-methyltransferase RsmB [Candidatus Baltobacteraceae bacterium]|jgi:16S rRNA (cytosine967-C5)-methyltransferase|nr:16S rRNA (cytosine(967)-C(5))-methyltransferase RsmB [Candidatus Baltobacteraceae bacterium]